MYDILIKKSNVVNASKCEFAIIMFKLLENL
jgi:hypothetical protein